MFTLFFEAQEKVMERWGERPTSEVGLFLLEACSAKQLAAVAVPLGKRNVFDGVGLRDRDPIAVSSGLSQRLTA